jgi:hypothetical protein
MTDLFKEKSTNWDANEMRTKMSQAIGSSILENVKPSEIILLLHIYMKYIVNIYSQ